MLKRVIGVFLLVAMNFGLCGCFALLAGTGGTALWQAGKVTSEEIVPMLKAVSAVEKTFRAKNITITEKVSKMRVVQLRGRNEAGKKVAVDVFAKGPKNSKIEIRIGVGEENSARDLLGEIKKNL